MFYATAWSLLPALVAIALALVTKEVYSSLFIGIVIGGLFFSGFSFEGTLVHVFQDGIVGSLADSYNMGIIIFLVVLGVIISILNKAGGSAAFGRWASKHIRTKIGAQLATIALGVLIFIDDYFNCLTVGSVMRPVTEKHGISSEKLAYLIDATAAPVCIIAPVSSWAAAVTGFVPESEINGFTLFLKAIPFNFYAFLTIVMMLYLCFTNFDYGSMALAEEKEKLMAAAEENSKDGGKAVIMDLIFPVAVLIISCVIGMLYSGGFFEGETFVDAFANSDASVGLMLGSAMSLVITIIYFLCRRTLKFTEIMSCVPEGFKAMVPAILILTFAWSLKAMTDSLGAREFVSALVDASKGSLASFLPAIIFVIASALAFATGTSWGTFGVLIPITLSVFPVTNPLGIVCVSACMAGAVCGDHCSPISDTTIMASAGARCDHVSHVSTQLPYAITCAFVSFLAYIFAGFVPNAWVALPVAIVLMVAVLTIIRSTLKQKN